MPKNLKELSQKAYAMYETMEKNRWGGQLFRTSKLNLLSPLKKLADENKEEKEIADAIFKLPEETNVIGKDKLQNIVKILKKCANVHLTNLIKTDALLTKTTVEEAETFITTPKDYSADPAFQENYLKFANEALLFVNPKNPKSISQKPEELKTENAATLDKTAVQDTSVKASAAVQTPAETKDPQTQEKLSNNDRRTIATLQDEITTHVTKIKDLENKNTKLTEENKTQKAEIAKLKNNLSSERKNFEEKIAETTNELAELKKQFDIHTKEMENLKIENQKSKKDSEEKDSYASRVKAGQTPRSPTASHRPRPANLMYKKVVTPSSSSTSVGHPPRRSLKIQTSDSDSP